MKHWICKQCFPRAGIAILLYVIGHLKEMFTADEDSDTFVAPDEEGNILEMLPVQELPVSDAVIGSDLQSRFDSFCLVVLLLLPVVKKVKCFLT